MLAETDSASWGTIQILKARIAELEAERDALKTELHQWEESDAARSVLEPVFTVEIGRLEEENARLRQNIDSAWQYAAYGYEIETRGEAEAYAAKVGMQSLECLMHLAWKRNPVVEPLITENARLRQALEDAPHDLTCHSVTERHIPGLTHYETDIEDERCPRYHFKCGPCDCWKAALAPEAPTRK